MSCVYRRPWRPEVGAGAPVVEVRHLSPLRISKHL